MLSIKKLLISLKSFFNDYQWAILAGIFTGTSYIPFPPWAVLFNYVPLWWYWSHKAETRKQVLWSGWITQFVFNLIGFHWVYHTAHEFGHIPIPLSLIVLLLFAALAHIYVPLVGLLFFELKFRFIKGNGKSRTPWPLIIALVGLWSLAEIYWPSIFQWHMGYTMLWAKLPIFHLADILGFQGLSTVLLLLNGLILWGLQPGHKDSLSRLAKVSGITITIVIALNTLGWMHGRPWMQRKFEKTINFLPVQANIGNAEKIMAERGLGYQDFIIQKFITLSKEALARHPEGQILVWPESAIPDYLDQDFSTRRRPQLIRQFLNETQRFLITGAYSKEFRGSAADSAFNALFIFGPQGELLSPPFRKKHLLAFGEYTPFAEWFPQLNEISPSGKGFSRGPGPQALTVTAPGLSTLKLAPQICYEALYPYFSREGVLAGAQILINVTNDSWFGSHSEPYQHLSMTLARAIENRRPLLRVTNTGFTSAIEASGKVLQQSPLYNEWSQVLPLSYDEKPSMTLYTRYGGFWPLMVALLTLGGIVGVIFNQTTVSKRKDQ